MARAARAALFAAAVVGPWATCLAADTDETDKLDEIIVTAQRREQNMQDVGTSVTAFDANTIEKLGFKDVTDIVGQVPGMQFNQYGATVTIYNLRGVSQNDFSDHQEAPIAVYSDDVYVANTGALAGSLFDLQRVEVLRGPQGTLFGRNATGGLIQYVSKQPTDAPDGYVQVTVGNYGLIQTEGAVGGPLSERVDTRAVLLDLGPRWLHHQPHRGLDQQSEAVRRAPAVQDQAIRRRRDPGQAAMRSTTITRSRATIHGRPPFPMRPAAACSPRRARPISAAT